MALIDLISQSTEVKTQFQKAAIEEAQNAAAAFWENEDLEDIGGNSSPQHSPPDRDVPAQAGSDNRGSQAPDEDSNQQSNKSDWTPELGRASAITGTEMFDNTLQLLFKPVINIKYNRKINKGFTEEQIDTLIEIEELNTNPDTLSDDDKRIYTKYEKLIALRDSKSKAVAFTEEEKDRTLSILEAYFEATQTSFSPKWLLGFTAVNSIGKRISDLLTD